MAIAAGIGGKTPVRPWNSSSSSHSCTVEPRANCHASQANMKSTIELTTSAIARRSRAHATPDSRATK